MNQSQIMNHSKRWDRSGIVIALICLFHCLALPVLVIFLPVFEFWINNTWLEIVLLILALSVGLFSFTSSYFRHRKKQPIVIGGLGLLFLVISLIKLFMSQPLKTLEHSHGGSYNLDYFLIAGGLLLVWGHISNIYACHCLCDHSCHDEEHQDHIKN